MVIYFAVSTPNGEKPSIEALNRFLPDLTDQHLTLDEVTKRWVICLGDTDPLLVQFGDRVKEDYRHVEADGKHPLFAEAQHTSAGKILYKAWSFSNGEGEESYSDESGLVIQSREEKVNAAIEQFMGVQAALAESHQQHQGQSVEPSFFLKALAYTLQVVGVLALIAAIVAGTAFGLAPAAAVCGGIVGVGFFTAGTVMHPSSPKPPQASL